MSINALTNAAAARRPDFAPFGLVPQGISGIAAAAARIPVPEAMSFPKQPIPAPDSLQAESMPVPEEVPLPQQPTSGSLQLQSANAINTAMHLLFGYIPTEIIGLYVAILAAMEPPLGEVNPAQATVFWIFLIATPVVVWITYAAKIKAANKPLPFRLAAWPIWEMFAGTVAYFAWAAALPTNPFQIAKVAWYSSAVAGIFELVASTILGLAAPFFQRKLGT